MVLRCGNTKYPTADIIKASMAIQPLHFADLMESKGLTSDRPTKHNTVGVEIAETSERAGIHSITNRIRSGTAKHVHDDGSGV